MVIEMKFNIDVETLVEYLEGIKGSDDGKIVEILIEYSPDGLVCSAKNPEVTRMVKAEMPKAIISSFEGQPEEFISTIDIVKLIGYLGRFKKKITVATQDNRLLIKAGEKEAYFVMPAKDYVQVAKMSKTIPYTHTFDINVELFQDAISNAGAIGKDSIYEVGIKDGQLYICSGDRKMDYFVEKTSIVGVGNIKSYFKAGFESLFANANGKIKVSMMEGGPMQTYYEKNGMKFTNVCPPFTVDEEVKTEEAKA